MKQPLPIGLQDFEEIRQKQFLYIDKTESIYRLVTGSKFYFLSRPRRFGKSLTLSTIKELFQGKRELFKNLWIENHWDWSQKHPVIHIHFESMGYKDKGLKQAIYDFLTHEARKHNLELTEQYPGSLLKEIIEKLYEKYGQQVVLLVDEYDKPIIDYLHDLEKAKQQRDELKGFYAAIKSSDARIRFLLITGVSKFSKVSIFSELNNLTDLTIHPKFTTLVGYTQEELEHYFEDRINELVQEKKQSRTKVLADIKAWYDGYSWDGKNFVYNPFSVLSFFGAEQFQNYWFSTGTPTFLIKLLRKRHQINLEKVEVDQSVFESYNLDTLDTLSLLFQTGYHTIKELGEFGIYTMDYPNKEVKESMLRHLIGEFRHDSPALTTPIVIKVRKAFIDHNLERVMTLINGLFKSIPSHIFIKEKEAYYHSVVFLVFQYLGQFITAEAHSSDGRVDAVVETDDHIYLLEFKLDQSADAALNQILEKDYASKYRLADKAITGVGINFSSETKSVESWKSTGL